jgi:hypothetical protein
LSVDKLVFDSGSPSLDIIPYPGQGPKAREKLLFAHQHHMTQKQLASCFKIQAAPQGVHLVSVASSQDADSQLCHFLKIVCECHLVYHKMEKAKKSETKEDAPAPLYIPGIKIVVLTKITCGIMQDGNKEANFEVQALPIPICVQMGE